MGSCFLSQVHRPRVPYCRGSSRILTDIRFKARIFVFKRQILAELLTTVKTNVNGRYSLEGLAAGNYRVTLVVNGAVKASINNTTLEPGESTHLNFELKQTRASVTVTKGKHWVWIPAFTGSRLPGHWVEADDNGGWASVATANHIVRVSAEELRREANTKASPTGY